MTASVVNKGRRRFLTAATSVLGAAGLAGVATPLALSWNPSARAQAAGAPVRWDVGKLQPGAMLTVEWRGQPVYIVRRTPEALALLNTGLENLRDPSSEESKQPAYVDPEQRSIRPDLIVLVGICTHLGCTPKYRPEVGAADLGGEDWHGGFFCPCHGSKFDLAGRVYTGVPAPTNLVVPPYRFESDSVIVIGEDQETA